MLLKTKQAKFLKIKFRDMIFLEIQRQRINYGLLINNNLYG